MIRVNLGSTKRYCDGMSRRSFLTLGVSGMASLGLPEILRAREQSARSGVPTRRTSVILIWLDGGPSHLDLYDMKPDAPAEYRGIWKPIRSKVPGFDITELFPKQARVTDKFSMVRSLHHDTGDHFAGGHRMLTTKDMGVSGANNEGKFPGIGAIVNRQVGPRYTGFSKPPPRRTSKRVMASAFWASPAVVATGFEANPIGVSNRQKRPRPMLHLQRALARLAWGC